MGVTISSPHRSIDLGYFGFFRLRRKIAQLVGEDVGEHYGQLAHTHLFRDKEEEEEYWRKYDALTEKMVGRYPKSVRKVFSFLYAPDCDGSVSYGTCKQILRVLGGYDDNIVYGYAGRPDGARMADFRRVLEDCVSAKKPMRWS